MEIATDKPLARIIIQLYSNKVEGEDIFLFYSTFIRKLQTLGTVFGRSVGSVRARCFFQFACSAVCRLLALDFGWLHTQPGTVGEVRTIATNTLE